MTGFLADLEQVAVKQVMDDKNFYPNEGVYAVFQKGEICYMGVTVSPVGRRLYQRKWDRTLIGNEFSTDLRPFTVGVIDQAEAERLGPEIKTLEMHLIRTLRPQYNRHGLSYNQRIGKAKESYRPPNRLPAKSRSQPTRLKTSVPLNATRSRVRMERSATCRAFPIILNSVRGWELPGCLLFQNYWAYTAALSPFSNGLEPDVSAVIQPSMPEAPPHELLNTLDG